MLLCLRPQIPEGKVKGVVFIAHACASKAIDFWPESTTCPNCRGLPEESRFAATVVARGFAALAISRCAQSGHKQVHRVCPAAQATDFTQSLVCAARSHPGRAACCLAEQLFGRAHAA